ncbi:hypothetical protein NDU88_002389 [Pleurodeles waltl]|uniref:Uncharacterized protein n=1 Tax=Pleurodeles waltl TaxID=8319 RepID=A0AAV7KS09_PLEWA|nr:hypothetical protein NDU88_002389 [Pleurodeles waltl]
MSALRAVRGEDCDPILGLRPRRVLTKARGWKKGPPRPLTRAQLPPQPSRETPRLPRRFSREAPQRPAAQQ